MSRTVQRVPPDGASLRRFYRLLLFRGDDHLLAKCVGVASFQTAQRSCFWRLVYLASHFLAMLDGAVKVGERDAMRLTATEIYASVVRPEGLEPPAYRFEACRSIQLSYGRVRVRV